MSPTSSAPDARPACAPRALPATQARRLRRRRATQVLVALLLAAGGRGVAGAQEIGSGSGARFGISVGGTGTIGLTAEYFRGHQGFELTVGTWSFHDVSVALDAKEYVGSASASVHPFVGLGFWALGAVPREPGRRLGFAAVLQAPIGVETRLVGKNSAGLFIDVNRALAVRRTDPKDRHPVNTRLVPLPGFYYSWTR